MTDYQDVEKEERLVDIRIWGIPQADLDWWMEIVRANGGNRKATFRRLLESYASTVLLGQLHTVIQSLDERVKVLEQKWQREGGNLKSTFGGGEI